VTWACWRRHGNRARYEHGSGVRIPPSARPLPFHRPCELRAARPRFRLRNALLGGKAPTVRKPYFAEITSAYISQHIVLFRLRSPISVCSAISLGSKVPHHGVTRLGTHACEHIAGGRHNPGPCPGMRVCAPVRGAARRAAREHRTAPAHAPHEPGRRACRCGSARPAARGPATSPRTTG